MKILLSKQNIGDVSEDISKTTAFFKEKLDLDLSFTIQEVSRPLDVEFKEFSKTIRGHALKTSIVEKGYDLNIFAYNAIGLTDDMTSYTTRVNGSYYCECTQFPYQINKGKSYIVYCHEIMHALFMMLTDIGMPLYDDMDLYDKNSDIYAPDGNFARNIARIKPYIHLLTKEKCTAILQRLNDNGKQTIGQFTVFKGTKPEIFQCKTMELPYRDNQKNISAIPKGEYQCKIITSPKFGKVFEVTKVPNRTGILLHPANYSRQLQGCIALGETFSDIDKDGTIDITNSGKTVQNFMSFVGSGALTLFVV